MSRRPIWTRSEHSATLWTEDDATPGTPGHETLHRAWKKRFDVDLDKNQWERKWDGGDCNFLLFKLQRLSQTDPVCEVTHWIVAVVSYPGNSEIRELKEPLEALLQRERDKRLGALRDALTDALTATVARWYLLPETVSRIAMEQAESVLQLIEREESDA